MEADCVLAKIQRENEQLKKYNQDLLNQIKLLNSKLSLFRKVGPEIGISFHDVCTQTDEMRDAGHISMKCAGHEADDWISDRNIKSKKVSDLVREVAEKVTGSNDYVWLKHESRFYCKSSGWYYYPPSQLFLDPISNKYFKFDPISNRHVYHSDAKIRKRVAAKITSRKKAMVENVLSSSDKDKMIEDNSDELSLNEEGEIATSDSSEASSDVEFIERDPPIKSVEEVAAARLVVKKSRSLELGSLIQVPPIPSFVIGLDQSSDLVLTTEDLNCELTCTLDHSHDYLMITYNEVSGFYEMKSSDDGNNLFKCLKVSKEQIEEGKMCMKHGSVFSLGSCHEFLIHVHDRKEITCVQCEPGCVQADLRDNASSSIKTGSTSLVTHRQRLKDLKRKYGLERDGFEDPSVNISPGFKDRSKERRIKKGSTNPYEKTASSSVDQHIPRENKGFKILEKMGWKHGSSIGSRASSGMEDSSASLEPICPKLKADRSGFGNS